MEPFVAPNAFGMTMPSQFSNPNIEVAYGGVFSEDDELQFGRMSLPPPIDKDKFTKDYEQGTIEK